MTDIEQALAEALRDIDVLPPDDPTDLWFDWSPTRIAAAILATEPMQVALRALAKDIGATAYAEGLHDAETNPERDRDAALGRAVRRLPDDFAWKVDYMPPPNEVAFFVYCYDRYGTGDTLDAAIAATLGDDDE